jgi:hypothetical protein
LYILREKIFLNSKIQTGGGVYKNISLLYVNNQFVAVNLVKAKIAGSS